MAEHYTSNSNKSELLGVARLIKLVEGKTAEFAILVGDAWQGQGVGKMLMEQLIEIGQREGYEQLSAPVLSENHAMQRLCRQLGFTLSRSCEENLVQATLTLT